LLPHLAASQPATLSLHVALPIFQARKVRERCRELGVLCIVNDDWRLATIIDADGVHLGRDDGSIAPARTALGPDKLIGSSCYDEDRKSTRLNSSHVQTSYAVFCL